MKTHVKLLALLFSLVLLPITVVLLNTEHWEYAILPGAGALILFMFGRRPQWGYYLIVFLVPLALFRTLYRTLTISKILGFWLIIFFFFYLILNKKGTYNVSGHLWKWLFFFFLINFLSTLLSDYPATAFDGMRKLTNAYLFFLLTLVFVTREGFTKILPGVIMAGAFIGSSLSVFGYLFNISSFYVNQGYREEFNRAVGGDTDPNDFSFMVIFSLPFFANLFFSSTSLKKRVIAGIGFSICLAAIILSYSRGGAIILLFALSIMAIEYLKRFRVHYLGLTTSLIGIGVLLFIALTPQSYWERQKSVSDVEDPAMSRRSSYLTVTFDSFLKNPILGAGTDSFSEIYAESRVSRRYAPGPDQSYRRVAHNAYAEVLTGSGIMGLIGFIIIIAATIRGFNKSNRQFLARGQPREAAMTVTYRMGFLVILAYFFFLSSNYHKFFWLSLALSQVAMRLTAVEKAGGDVKE
jgi:putative inorganic carbon (hco3(-)) transporter